MKTVEFNYPVRSSSLFLYNSGTTSSGSRLYGIGYIFKPKETIKITRIKHLFSAGSIGWNYATSMIYLINDNDINNLETLSSVRSFVSFEGSGDTNDKTFYHEAVLEAGKNYLIAILNTSDGSRHIKLNYGENTGLSDNADIELSDEVFTGYGTFVGNEYMIRFEKDSGNFIKLVKDNFSMNMSITYEIVNNQPYITLNTENNKTLYENDTLQVSGTARDDDANQSVTVYYQINSETRRVLATDLSQKNIALSKQLTFKGGKLYDGATAITAALTEGVAHKLKVWAVDSEGAESTPQTRTFYVVPNRAPTLTIDEVVPSGTINSDKFSIGGHAGDPDANANVTVTYRINENNSIQVYEGPGGAFSFDIALGQLVVGQNTIVVEVIDNYGAKTNKTIKLNKNEIKTPLLKSTARFKLEPPAGSAKGVLLYIQRDQNLVIDVKISMTLKGEPENFVQMTLENTAPLPNDVSILEDEFYYETTEAKDNIIVQVDMIRTSLDVSDTITLIQGAFD